MFTSFSERMYNENQRRGEEHAEKWRDELEAQAIFEKAANEAAVILSRALNDIGAVHDTLMPIKNATPIREVEVTIRYNIGMNENHKRYVYNYTPEIIKAILDETFEDDMKAFKVDDV